MIFLFWILSFDTTDIGIRAASEGDLVTLQTLVNEGLPLDTDDDLGRTLVHLAIERGHESLVSWLLMRGANPCKKSGYYASSLTSSVPYPEILRKLLTYPFSKRQKYAAMRDAVRGHQASLQLLLEAGVSPNNELAPLNGATVFGCWSCAKMLLEAGAKERPHYDKGLEPQFKGITGSGIAGLLEFSHYKDTCLSGTYVAHEEMIALGRELLQMRAPQGDLERNQALYLAACGGCPHLLNLVRDFVGQAGSHLPELINAVVRGDLQRLQTLISLGKAWTGTGANPYDLNGRFYLNKETLIFYLVSNRTALDRERIIKLLTEQGANPDLKNKFGESPISKACKNQEIEMLRVLVEVGADWSKNSGDEGTPIYWAVKGKNLPALYLFLKNGASLDTIEKSALDLGMGPDFLTKSYLIDYIEYIESPTTHQPRQPCNDL